MALFDKDYVPTRFIEAKYFLDKCNFLKKIREEIYLAEIGFLFSDELEWLKEELIAQRRSSNSLDLYEEEDN